MNKINRVSVSYSTSSPISSLFNVYLLISSFSDSNFFSQNRVKNWLNCQLIQLWIMQQKLDTVCDYLFLHLTELWTTEKALKVTVQYISKATWYLFVSYWHTKTLYKHRWVPFSFNWLCWANGRFLFWTRNSHYLCMLPGKEYCHHSTA